MFHRATVWISASDGRLQTSCEHVRSNLRHHGHPGMLLDGQQRVRRLYCHASWIHAPISCWVTPAPHQGTAQLPIHLALQRSSFPQVFPLTPPLPSPPSPHPPPPPPPPPPPHPPP